MDPRFLAPRLRPIVIIPPSEDPWGPVVPFKLHRPALVSHCPITHPAFPAWTVAALGWDWGEVRVRVRVLLPVPSSEIFTILQYPTRWVFPLG